jgi:hypothetical protein
VFLIQKHPAHLTHINVREERHGDETIVAMDLKLTMDTANDFLNDLSPGLAQAIYAPHATQGSLDGRLVTKKFALLGPITWEGEGDFRLAIHHNDWTRAIQGEINKISIVCKDGGTIVTTFRFQLSPADGEVIAEMSELLGQNIKISIEEAEVEESQEPEEATELFPSDEYEEVDPALAPAKKKGRSKRRYAT